jgi:MFS family permease
MDLSITGLSAGSVIGFLFFTFLSDNIGRKKAMIYSQIIYVSGNVLFVVSPNLTVAGIALLIIGFAFYSANGQCAIFISEVFDADVRNKFIIFLFVFYTFGSMTAVLMFYTIYNWQLIWIICMGIPSVAVLASIILLIEETPQFLLRMGVERAMKSLNKIGKINKGVSNIITKKDIESVMEFEVQTKQFEQLITPIDLFRFRSLRGVTINVCLLTCCLFFNYYGPVFIVDQVGLDIYSSSLVFSLC